MAIFLPLLHQALVILLEGGSRQLLDLDEELEPLIDALLPPKDCLWAWLYGHISSGESAERIAGNIRVIAGHPTTVAFTFHPGDMARVANHIHVLSRAPSRDDLPLPPDGGGCSQVKTSAFRYLSYMDHNDSARYSLDGATFGPASSPELRILVSLQHFWGRCLCVSGGRAALGTLFHLAKFLFQRVMNRDRLAALGQPILPRTWETYLVGLLFDIEQQIAQQDTWLALELNDWKTRILLAWKRLWMECSRRWSDPPPILGYRRYYGDLLAALFVRDNYRIANSFFRHDYRGNLSLDQMRHAASINLGSFEYDESVVRRQRESYMASRLPYWWERGEPGSEPDEDARLVAWMEDQPAYADWLFAAAYAELFRPAWQRYDPANPTQPFLSAINPLYAARELWRQTQATAAGLEGVPVKCPPTWGSGT